MVSLLLILCLIFSIPSVQTYVAQKAANYLSEQMQTVVSIDKLHISWNLDIVATHLVLKDRRGKNLIAAKYAECDFPQYDKLKHQLTIPRIYAEDAEVFIALYKGEQYINMQFFIDYLTSGTPSKSTLRISLQNLCLKKGKFTFYNERSLDEDKQGHWNYSNIVIDSIYSKMDELLIINDSLNFEIKELRCQERSGFAINTFKGHLRLSSTGLYCLKTQFTTPHHSNISVDFGFKYQKYSDFSDFIYKISFDCKLYPSNLSLVDLVYFVPAFKGMNDKIKVEAEAVYGCLADLNIENAQLKINENNYIETDVRLLGLPNIDSTLISAKVNNLRAESVNIEQFTLPEGKKIQLPELAKKFKWIQANGSYIGYYYNFLANLNFKTALGNGSVKDLSFKSEEKIISYNGIFNLENIALDQIADYKDLGNCTASGKICGNNANIDSGFIKISSIEYRDNAIHNIELTGELHNKELTFSLISPDKNFNTAINGMINFNPNKKEYSLTANIDTLNLSSFKLFRNDSNAILSATSIIANLRGNTINELEGYIDLQNLKYCENDIVYPLQDIRLNVQIDNNKTKHIQLNSNALSIQANGKFMYNEVIPMLQNELNRYVPHAIIKTDKIISDSTQNIDILANMNNAVPLFELLFPYMIFKKGFALKAHFDKVDKDLHLTLSVPSLQIKQQTCKDINIQSYNVDNSIILTATSSSFWLANDTLPFLTNINLQTEIKKDTITYMIMSDGLSTGTLKNIFFQGNVGFTSPHNFFCLINNGSLVVDSSTYLFDPSNYVSFNPDSITVKNIGLTCENKRIHLSGAISSLHPTSLDCEFNKINLKDFELIFKKYFISLGGEATGKASIVSNLYGFNILSNINISQFTFNNVLLGEFKGSTVWKNDNKKLWIAASIIPDESESQDLTIDVYGYFDPIEKYIDLKGDIQEFNIKTLEPYINFFANKVEGIGTGYLTFSGPSNSAKLRGNIHLTGGILGIDVLKTEYKINQCNIEFIDTGFIFKNITFKDNSNNYGIINGIITHHHLQNWDVDLNINAKNILALNTSYKDNNLFYGKAYGSGEINIKTEGAVTWITANVKTEKNTHITVNMDWNTSVSENKFIIFEKEYKEDVSNDTLPTIRLNNSKVALSLNITATPDASVRVELDPSIGGTLTGTGNGSLRFDLTPEDKFEMYGSYILNNGNFELNLGDVLARNFKLENGGSVSWNGKPSEGVVNVKASYPTRVSISDLLTESESNNNYKSIPVNSILYLNGNILNPEFNFGIELIDVDENIKKFVYNAIDTTDRKQMVSQTFSMLLLGRFESNSTNTVNSSTFIAGLGYSLSDLASHYLNKWMASITDKVNLGFTYRPGDGSTTTDDYNVQVSTNLFDNRLNIQGSLNIYDNNNQAVTGNIAGDFIVEYKLTKDGAFRIKAFRMSNYYDNILTQNSELYSQGIGLSYTKNFNTIKELFTIKKKEKFNK